MPTTRTIRVNRRDFTVKTTWLEGVDSGLVEATCTELPDVSDYSNNTDDVLDLIRDTITTTLKMRRIP